MPLLGAANLSLNKAHDRGRQCNSKARADICKQLLARASLDYSPNPPGGWDLARSRVFSQHRNQRQKTLQKFGGCLKVKLELMLKSTTLLLKKHILPNLAGKA